MHVNIVCFTLLNGIHTSVVRAIPPFVLSTAEVEDVVTAGESSLLLTTIMSDIHNHNDKS